MYDRDVVGLNKSRAKCKVRIEGSKRKYPGKWKDWLFAAMDHLAWSDYKYGTTDGSLGEPSGKIYRRNSVGVHSTVVAMKYLYNCVLGVE